MPANKSLSTVLITGATDGLGRAAALLLAQCGYRVFAAGRSPEKRTRLDALAREQKMPLETLEMDVCDDASAKRAVAAVYERAGSIDVLINNAGLGIYATAEDLRLPDLQKILDTNLLGVVRVTQAVLPGMRAQRCGRIINISSVAGKVAPALYGGYSASKFALEGLSDALRLEVYPFGIEVVLIEPGYISTGFQQASGEFSATYFRSAKGGPYASLYEKSEKSAADRKRYEDSSPEDFARVVLRAIEDSRPRIRYTVTRLATVVRWAKRILPDRAMDAILRKRSGLRRDAQSCAAEQVAHPG